MTHSRVTMSILVMMAGLAAACGGGAARDGALDAGTVKARVARAELATVPTTVELYGSVEATRAVAVSSRVMASVTAVHVKVGDTVRAGAALVDIDPETARGQESQARGALAQAQAGLALATRNFERFKALQEKGAASELELDMARMQHEQARGAVQQAQGAVDAATSVARESRVVAPFAGRVAARLVEAGDLAAPGRPLIMLESQTGRRLVAPVPETAVRASGLKLGAQVPVALDAHGRDRVLATVTEMSPGADPAAHTFLVKLDLGDLDVTSGAAGRAVLQTGERQAVSVPREAVLSPGGVSLVVVRDAQGVARTRAVTLGAGLDGDRIEVLSGLKGGEDVLLGLGMAPSDGARVEEVRP